ncbi:iron-regulated protein A precursor [Flavobacterium oncorhynchi]|uniref:Iron-regulated protein A n=1 Tax=Flavobacterium oncorhynchi TaxID=728056 RepID=A0A226HYD7_9FLAO|nr:imelysin family protein [Flavobacterium oncorhynchi]OXA99134.1 iron-regulated protein A precursor [Flavobacterium oncorhynchi]
MKKKALILGFVIALVACSSNSGDDTVKSNSFDRTTLLTNWADNIIIPSYTNYQSKLQSLTTSTNTFVATPTESNLKALRASWLESYKAYQYISMYNFGKAEEINLNMAANTYPTDAAGIETNISNGVYNLSLLSQFSRQGFPGMDYLINGLGTTDASIVTFYSSNANATNYKKYLTDITSKLKANADAVVIDWNSGYRVSYITNNGTSVTSAVNKTTNAFVKNLEKDIRTGKLGIPAGLFSNGVKYPEKVEAFYKKDISKELLVSALQAQQDFFNGKHFNSPATGASLKSYLDFLNVVRDTKKLSDIINAQFAAITVSNNALSNNFSEQITTDNAKMIAAYSTLQQNVIYTKLDMMQALNITIDYVDGDGD